MAELDNLASDMQEIRDRYIGVIEQNNVTHAENIANMNDWLIYIYYCEFLNRLVPDKNSMIIDWGGLYGHITQILREKGFNNTHNYLLHVSHFYKLFLDEFSIPTIYGRNPNELKLENASIDIMISSGVLEHVREDGIGREELIIKEFHRVLKPNGLLFIWNLPTKLCLADLKSKLLREFYHKYRYRWNEISRLLKNGGFEVIYMERYGSPGVSAIKYVPFIKDLFMKDRMIADFWISRVPLSNIFCNHFGIVARKMNKF